MSSDPRQHLIQALTVPLARSVLAIVLALSFLTTVVSFNTASSAATGTMACCIGKPGHETGSCKTGLVEPARTPQPEPEILCGQEPAPPTAPPIDPIDIEAEAAGGGHCSLHPQSPGDVPSNSEKHAEPEAVSVKSRKTSPLAIHALTTPCPAECGTCSVSYTRRPRPREHTTLSSSARPCLHLTRRVLTTDDPHVNTLNTKWMQLRPRAPPNYLA
jgi:hypothetical protein